MKFTVMRDALRDAASTAASFTGKSTMPVLQNALVEAADDRVTLTATNLDTTVRLSVAAEVSAPGSATLPAKLLSDIASKVSAGTVAIELDGDAAEVSAGRSLFKLPTLATDEFPHGVIPEYPDSHWTLPGEELAAVAAVGFTASTEETRTHLQGVYLKADGETLKAVATNGHRLARRTIPCPEGASGELIVPAVALTRAAKMFANQAVTIRFSDRTIGIYGAHAEIHCRLFEGPYPETDQLYPAEFGATIRCDRLELLGAVSRVALVVRDDEAMRGTFELNGTLVISAGRDARAGDEIAEVDCGGAEMRVGFNLGYIAESLTHFGGEEIEWAWSSPERPSVMRVVGEDLSDILIMPLRLTN